MSSSAYIARPYAKAAFHNAREHNDLERWSHVLNYLAAVVRNDKVAGWITDPRVEDKALLNALNDICGDLLIERYENFLKLLVSKKRAQYLPEIARLYDRLRLRYESTLDAHIKSFSPLSLEQQRELSSALEKRFGKKVNCFFEEDKSILGGFIVYAGEDNVIDASVKGKIRRLAQDLIRE